MNSRFLIVVAALVIFVAGAWMALRPPDLQDIPAPRAEAANLRLAHAVKADLACFDASRILRPPGTWNFKHTPPRPVAVQRLHPEHRFELDEVIGHLPVVGEKTIQRRWERPAPRVVTDDPLLSYEEYGVGNLTIGRGYDPSVISADGRRPARRSTRVTPRSSGRAMPVSSTRPCSAAVSASRRISAVPRPRTCQGPTRCRRPLDPGAGTHRGLPPATRQHPHRERRARRAATERQADPPQRGRIRPERAGETDLLMGGDPVRAHRDRVHLWDELHAHPRARMAAGLPLRDPCSCSCSASASTQSSNAAAGSERASGPGRGAVLVRRPIVSSA